jgi:hypothetical protein
MGINLNEVSKVAKNAFWKYVYSIQYTFLLLLNSREL